MTVWAVVLGSCGADVQASASGTIGVFETRMDCSASLERSATRAQADKETVMPC